MIKKISLLVLPMLGFFHFPILAESQVFSPKIMIESLKDSIIQNIVGDQKMKGDAAKDKALFNQEREKNLQSHHTLAKYIDFEQLGTVSLPKKWQDKFWISSSDKKTFLTLLQDLIEEIVYPRAKDFFEKHKLVYQKEKNSGEGGKDLFYNIEIKKKSGEIEKLHLIFRVRKKQEAWKICDIRLDKELWSEMFKNQFNHIITTKSYDVLLEKMKEKLKRVQTGEAY